MGGIPRFRAESPWAWRLVIRYARALPARTRTQTRGRRPKVSDAAGTAPVVLICADPEAYLLPAAAHRLVARIEDPGKDLVLPVTNEPWSKEARLAPPFAYQTPRLLEEAVDAIAAKSSEVRRALDPRSPVFAVRRDLLAALPASFLLDEVPQEAARRGKGVFIDLGIYVHRYGQMNGQAREDLAAKVPPGARCVLDLGCSRGATGASLRQRGVVRIVGIEPDREDAGYAAQVYDQVLALPLEEVDKEFPGEFDAALFGDVLEHLEDPSEALSRVRPWLSSSGVAIASVPNLGHWSVIADLLEGRFDYVPYSILSGTHVRFFTRRTVHDLFEACGYSVESVDTVAFSPSPAGAERLSRLSAFPGASVDLNVAEFLVVARPLARHSEARSAEESPDPSLRSEPALNKVKG